MESIKFTTTSRSSFIIDMNLWFESFERYKFKQIHIANRNSEGKIWVREQIKAAKQVSPTNNRQYSVIKRSLLTYQSCGLEVRAKLNLHSYYFNSTTPLSMMKVSMYVQASGVVVAGGAGYQWEFLRGRQMTKRANISVPFAIITYMNFVVAIKLSMFSSSHRCFTPRKNCSLFLSCERTISSADSFTSKFHLMSGFSLPLL